MDWYYILLILIGGLVFFMLLGLPVVFAFFTVNLIGAFFFMGGLEGIIQLVKNAVYSVQSFTLLPIPLFIFMGEIMFHTGIASRAIDAVDKLIAKVPGRLSLVAIVGGTIFSSLSGSTIVQTWLLAVNFDWTDCCDWWDRDVNPTVCSCRSFRQYCADPYWGSLGSLNNSSTDFG